MKLYHGSTTDIQHIELSKSKPNKDFGRAFYLSVDFEQAMEMAQFKADIEDAAPVINAYEFDDALFSSSVASVLMITPKSGRILYTTIEQNLTV